jgi:benzoyl-CoA reductase/2-hydroxyglutaryl-CoA dehydratase subunit BcrC/BadD/HgdB
MALSNSEIPAEITRANQDRLAAGRAHHQSGGDVCGYFGSGMPLEVAIATGHLPIAIMPPPERPTPHADEWVNPSFDPQLRLIFDQLLSGELEFCRLAVAVSQASPDSVVFQAAREILRQGAGAAIPPLHHYSLLGLQSEAVREYGQIQIEALARRLRADSGQEATAARLESAIELMNAIRAQWRELNRLRFEGRLSGSDALSLIAASRFMAPSQYLPALTRANQQFAGRTLKRPRLIVVSANLLSDSRLHASIEAAGAVVIGEFDSWGSCSAAPDIAAGDNPLAAIYQHYYTHEPNRSVYPAATRLRWFFENANATEVDGVIIHMPRTDRSLGWDYPRMRDFLAAHKKPLLMNRDDAFADAGRAAITQAVSTFIGQIKERAA